VVKVSTLLSADEVRVAVPARPEFVHVLRSVTASVAGHLSLSLDDVDDLRLAVDEACARLLALPGEPKTFRLVLCSLPGRVEVILTAGGTATWPHGGLEDSLSWRLLAALTDDLRFELWNGAPAIRFVKRMLGARVR
jgi:serine/threonine-protein kinase RsbW